MNNLHQNGIARFVYNNRYWSSTEEEYEQTWSVTFSGTTNVSTPSSVTNGTVKDKNLYVRPVCAF